MELTDLIQALQQVEAAKAGRPQSVYKHNSPTGTPSTPYYTGPGGLFGVSGGLPDRDVLSTRVQPRGLLSALPWKGSVYMNPLFAYLTGFRAEGGTQKTTVCSDAPTPGSGKSCYQTAQFGRYEYETRELEVNRVGQRTDRSEMWDLRFVNDPLGEALGLSMFTGTADALLNGREMLARIVEVGVAYQNKLVRQIYSGNPANSAAGGGYKEFPGLDILIGTNKVDALTGTDCPSLDSLIRNANYTGITTPATFDIVNEVTNIARNLKWNAERMGYEPATWVITMRSGLFYELTKLWPCSYLTLGCVFRTTDGTVITNVSPADAIAMRDAMRQGRYLLIDGEQWPVILDDGIVEESSADTNQIATTCFASDIYFIPMTVKGGFPVTYMEYFDYGGGTTQAVADGNYTGEFWTDGGKFLWVRKPQLNWCVQLQSKIEPRLIFRAPYLAARLTNVEYCPLIHTRDSLPEDDYFANGGVSTPRAAPSYYSDWNLPA